MLRDQNFVALSQVPHGKLNDIQDHAAPVTPFVGYKRGGDIYTKAANKIIYISPLTLCMTANGVDVASNANETSYNTDTHAGINSWNYLYATIIAGVISYFVGQPADSPDTALVFDNAASNYRYLGCFFCDGAGNILPFTKTGTRYLYRRSQVASTVFRFFTSAVVAAWAAQSLVALVPPHVRVVHVELRCTNTTAVDQASMGVRTTGDTGFEAGRVYTAFSGGAIETASGVYSLECDTSNRIDVDVVSTPAGGTVTANGYVVGFDERSV